MAMKPNLYIFFSDASKNAYAVAVFIRVESNECVKVHILQARTRVASTGKKETAIARLELPAATISARLSSVILGEFDHAEVFFWTDSSTVLTWIKKKSGTHSCIIE